MPQECVGHPINGTKCTVHNLECGLHFPTFGIAAHNEYANGTLRALATRNINPAISKPTSLKYDIGGGLKTVRSLRINPAKVPKTVHEGCTRNKSDFV